MAKFKECLEDVLRFTDREPGETASRAASVFGGFPEIAQTDSAALSKWFSDGDAMMLKVLAALSARRITDSFRFGREYTEEELFVYLCALYSDRSNETVYLVSVDDKNRIVACDFVTEGTVNSTGVLPRQIIEIMIARDVRRAIIVHNHPNGVATPSAEDVNTTERLAEAFAGANKELIAHYIVAGKNVRMVE